MTLPSWIRVAATLILAALVFACFRAPASAGEEAPGPVRDRREARDRDAPDEADEEGDREGHDGERDEDWRDEEEDVQDDEEREEEFADEANVFLGRTLRIHFDLVPKDDPREPPRWILLATRRYAYAVEFGNDDEGFGLEVEGGAHLLDNPDTVLLTFEAFMEFRGPGHRGIIRAKGSAVIVLGRPTPIASLGDKMLVVRVTPGDEPPGPPPHRDEDGAPRPPPPGDRPRPPGEPPRRRPDREKRDGDARKDGVF